MIRLAAAALMLTTVNPAAAGWQDLEWGQPLAEMLGWEDVSEVPQEERADLRLGWGDEGLARGPHMILGNEAEATYYFRDEGLSMVEVEIDRDADRGRMARALDDIYGIPDIVRSYGDLCTINTRVWLATDRSLRVEHMTSGCSEAEMREQVRYWPLATAENSGL